MAKIGSSLILPEAPKAMPIPPGTSTLVNITTVKFPIIQFTYGNFMIPSIERGFQTMRDENGQVEKRKCAQGEEWAAMKIRAARDAINYGEDRKNEFIIESRDICLDLCRQCNGDIWGIGNTITGDIGGEDVRGFSGVFLADNDEPGEQELAEMHALLRLCDVALTEEGHKTYDQFHDPRYIHEGFKRGARRLGVEAEWLYAIINAPDCPFCGSKMKSATASVCATCGRDVPKPSAKKEAPGHATPPPPQGKGKGHQKQNAAA